MLMLVIIVSLAQGVSDYSQPHSVLEAFYSLQDCEDSLRKISLSNIFHPEIRAALVDGEPVLYLENIISPESGYFHSCVKIKAP